MARRSCHWGLRDGIFGQLAGGGDARTFRPVGAPRTRRAARARARRNGTGRDVARSERLAALVFAHRLARHGHRETPLAADRPAVAGASEWELAGALARLDELASACTGSRSVSRSP